MVQPNFLIVGAQKCGTTSLWTALREHPGIHVANEKELNHFNDSKTEYKTDEWYENNFIPEDDVMFKEEFKSGTTPVGEASVNYLYFPEAARRMKMYNPYFKLIVVLRDPVRRAISQYHWEVRMTNEKLSMPDAFAAEKERLKLPRNFAKFSYKARGRYLEQLDRLFQYFFRESVLILSFEDLVNSPLQFMNSATDFIGAPRWDGYTLTHALKNDYPEPNPVHTATLSNYFEEPNKLLEAAYGIDTGGWM